MNPKHNLNAICLPKNRIRIRNSDILSILGYSYGVWLGFSDIQKEGQFLALSDRKRPRYVNWMQGAPNNGQGGTEHCAMYWIARKGWNDEKCSIRLNYVCTKWCSRAFYLNKK